MKGMRPSLAEQYAIYGCQVLLDSLQRVMTLRMGNHDGSLEIVTIDCKDSRRYRREPPTRLQTKELLNIPRHLHINSP